MSAADNNRALLQHEAIKALAKQRGVTPDMVIDAIESGNAEVRNEVDAMVAVELARLYRSNAMLNVHHHHHEPAANEPVGLSGSTVVWLLVLGVLAVLGIVAFVAGWWK